jgi:hypothetical protein
MANAQPQLPIALAMDSMMQTEPFPMADEATQTEPLDMQNYGEDHLMGDFKPGVILSAPSHTPYFDIPNSRYAETHTKETDFGKVYSKVRKLIVIARFTDHCLTLPIFTFNGNGFQNKGNKSDFCWNSGRRVSIFWRKPQSTRNYPQTQVRAV